jgi:tetratricopeptide (TPR) repeat protein
MNKGIGRKFSSLLLVLGVLAMGARAQAPPPQRPHPQVAPVTNVTVDGNEAMFTVMCALYASGFEGDVSADKWSTFRAQMRERMKRQQGPAVDAIREFYQKHDLQDASVVLSRYVWFGLVSGPAPKFEPIMRRDELPPEVLALEGFTELLANYYKEQKIGTIWRSVQPIYNQEIERLHDPISSVVTVATAYLREVLDPAESASFAIVVEPLVGRITNVRNYGSHYAIILSGSEEVPVDVVRHAFLHFLLDPLPLTYAHVVVVKRPIYELAAKAPRLAPDLRDEYFSWFTECTVRAVEIKLQKLSPGEREVSLARNDADGYVMVRPIYGGLANFEKSEPAMKIYFPDLVRGIDLKAEELRVAEVKFAPADSNGPASSLSAEEVARRRKALPATVPNDQDALASLTEGERRIAEHNPRAAEIAFKSVLVKYPDQPRAWFGLGMVAVLDHDAVRAKEVFGRLTVGEHAAGHDPMVMAWSYVYLARVLEDEGQLESAKSDYQSAINVQGAPAQAQQAAQKGLKDIDTRKSLERP